MRLPLCRAAGQPTAAPGTVNNGLIDTFTLVHAAGGFFFGALGLGFLPMLLLAVGWEVAEHLLKDCIPNSFVHPTQDTIRNAASDVVVALVGWALGRVSRAVAVLLRAGRRQHAASARFPGEDPRPLAVRHGHVGCTTDSP
jgi:hypothetical protein